MKGKWPLSPRDLLTCRQPLINNKRIDILHIRCSGLSWF